MRKSRRKKAGAVFQVLAIAVPAAMITAGVLYAACIYTGYAKGRQGYRNIEDQYTSSLSGNENTPDATGSDTPDMHTADQEGGSEETDDFSEDVRQEGNGLEMGNKHVWGPLIAKLPPDAPERKQVDWESLLERNQDVIGWITVPAVGISYPVMQAEDNDYYLHRDIDRNYLFAGSIFMDEDSSPSLLRYNTIIYGHNMRDGSMFAKLRDFQDKETWNTCRYFWIQTPEEDCLYEIFSIHTAATGSDTFTIQFADYEVFESWRNRMISLSDPATGIGLKDDDRIVTLSTCTESSQVRMTVQGKLIWKRSLEESEGGLQVNAREKG